MIPGSEYLSPSNRLRLEESLKPKLVTMFQEDLDAILLALESCKSKRHQEWSYSLTEPDRFYETFWFDKNKVQEAIKKLKQ